MTIQVAPTTSCPETRKTLPARTRKRLLELEFQRSVLNTMVAATSDRTEEIPAMEKQQHDSHFLCPITKKPLKDPVVRSDGISYERGATRKRGRGRAYPNRVLKSIIEESSVRPLGATMKILQEALENDDHEERESQIAEALGQLLSEMGSLPEAYCCPITLRPMKDPVIDPEGNTYDRAALVSWLEEKGTSPITRNPVNVRDLYPNHALSLSRTLQQLKTSLQRWQETNRAQDIAFFKEILSICGQQESSTSIPDDVASSSASSRRAPDPPASSGGWVASFAGDYEYETTSSSDASVSTETSSSSGTSETDSWPLPWPLQSAAGTEPRRTAAPTSGPALVPAPHTGQTDSASSSSSEASTRSSGWSSTSTSIASEAGPSRTAYQTLSSSPETSSTASLLSADSDARQPRRRWRLGSRGRNAKRKLKKMIKSITKLPQKLSRFLTSHLEFVVPPILAGAAVVMMLAFKAVAFIIGTPVVIVAALILYLVFLCVEGPW